MTTSVFCLLFAFAVHNSFLCDESPSQETAPLSSFWAADVDKALALAKEEKKNLIIAFLGGASCPWSEKLKQEVLNTSDFFNRFEGLADFVAVELDEQSAGLGWQQMLGIEQTPTLVVLDYSQEEIARLGFLPLSPREYADQVLLQIQNFEEVIAFLKHSDMRISEEKMIELYMHAKKLSSQSYRNQILQVGLKSEKGVFFLLEKYADLLETSKLNSPIAQKARKELIDKDPENQMGTRLKVAVLEFQYLGVKGKGKNRAQKAISPLLKYVQQFGKKDLDNLWKVEMMMAQFLFAKDEKPLALSHAQASLEAAPEAMKQEVRDVVDYLSQQM